MVDTIVNEVNPFVVDSEPNISNIMYTDKIKSIKKEIKYEPDFSKKDLLYYGILDFVSKNKENGTRRALEDHYSYFKKKYSVGLEKNRVIGCLVNELFKDADPDSTLKELLKAKKKEIRNTPGNKKSLTKRVIKALKVYQHLFQEDTFPNLSEDEYLYLFVRPLIKIVKKDIKFLSIKCGESNLRCASRRQNQKLFDEERRNPGPKIDIIFTHKFYEQEIAVLEISGPNNKINNSHFLGDRNKITKNLKHIFKSIIGSFPPSSVASVKRLKVYGFQLYDDTFFIYSLSTANNINYIFSLESSFAILMTAATIKQNSPLFLSMLWTINVLFIETNSRIKEIQDNSLENNILSSDSSDGIMNSSSPCGKRV